jgi:hypothetical protein
MNDEKPAKVSEVISLRLPVEVLDELRSQARDGGLQVSEILREAIRDGRSPVLAVWPSLSVTQGVVAATSVPYWLGGENHGSGAVEWEGLEAVELGEGVIFQTSPGA